MGKFLDEAGEGEALFKQIDAGEALRTLRHVLRVLDIKEWYAYRTHDLRRGHALDLQLSGRCHE